MDYLNNIFKKRTVIFMDIQLFEHNKKAYENVVAKLDENNRTCVIHPTGSGKSFIALKWLLDNRNKRCLFLTSYSPILEQIKRHILDSGLTLNDFPNLQVGLYANINSSNINNQYDCIVLDEFHRCGAKEWGTNVNLLLNNNLNSKVLGISATPIRYLDDQRDMSIELFNGNIASYITLAEAVANGILPMPKYIGAIYSFASDIETLQNKINRLEYSDDRIEFQRKLDEAKKVLEKSEGLSEIFNKHIEKSNGKYIVFCKDYEHMQKMIEESSTWFSGINYSIDLYSVYSNYSDKQNRDIIEQFEKNNNDSFKLLFSIDMLNEGLHVKDIDGVIMLRPTVSPILYMQQLGRALSVGKTAQPLIFDIVNNSKNIDEIKSFFEEVRKIKSERSSILQKKNMDSSINIETFKVIDESADFISILSSIDSKLTNEKFLESKGKQLFEDLLKLGHQPNRYNSKEESRLYTMLITRAKDILTREQQLELSKFGIYIPKKLSELDLSEILFNELLELGHQPRQTIKEELALYGRLVQRGERFLSEEQLAVLKQHGIYIPLQKNDKERSEDLYNELIDLGHQPKRTDSNEVNLYGRLQRNGKKWFNEQQISQLSKLGITVPNKKTKEEESTEFYNELINLGHQPKKSISNETSIYKKLIRRGKELLTEEQLKELSKIGISIPVKLEEKDYVEQTFIDLINLGHIPSNKEDYSFYQRYRKWKGKFTPEQLYILSTMNIIDINEFDDGINVKVISYLQNCCGQAFL